MPRRQQLTGSALLAALLISTPAQARLDWTGFAQYSADARFLHYQVHSEPVGTLLVWPELNQTHQWLPIASEWQRRGWKVLLLQPDERQQQFDPTSEQPPPSQGQWLKQLSLQLSDLLSDHALLNNRQAEKGHQGSAKEIRFPLVVITQGSAALWFQQLVDGGAIVRPQALILFDALPSHITEQQMLATSLAHNPYPILDIYSHPDSLLARHNQQRRQQQLGRREQAGYTLLRGNGPVQLNKQIAGWMVRLGWLPLPPSAPDYLKEQHSETGISRSTNPGTGN
ncbi:DUF3530 family protein [Oceanisphaera sp.]|uniref:DUF3530 family protein n=1 Tax=Oceanisphaera sp. TaxID=1929979 RepID=UPI003A91BE24